jgi:hypothetical protein
MLYAAGAYLRYLPILEAMFSLICDVSQVSSRLQGFLGKEADESSLDAEFSRR